MTTRKHAAEPDFLLALDRYRQQGVLAWHTPGHKQGRGASPALLRALGQSLALDVSDVLADERHHDDWDEVLLEAEARAAEAFGAAWTRFLVNGTSGGIQAMLLAVLQDGDRLILPRAAHMSVVAGLTLCGAVGEYLPYRVDRQLGLEVPPSAEDYAEAIATHPDAKSVLVTYPNYYGMCADLAAIAAVAESHGMWVLVDEAHGAHYAFHPQLPPTALSCGAHITVQSAHKTLGALTQSSMLHAAAAVDHAALDRALTLVKSTSPNALLLGSLDAARAQMAVAGKQLWSSALEQAGAAREQINALPGWLCLTPDRMRQVVPYWDSTRLIIGHQCKSGLAVARALRDQMGMQVEMADHRYVVALVGLGDGPAEINRLVCALRELDVSELADRSTFEIDYPAMAPRVMSPRAAYQQKSVRVPWTHAVGRTCIETICPYPPGIPLIVPGEEITPEIVTYVDWARAQGFTLRGDLGDGCIGVVA
ncbi:MAG: aminotransferase class I/II-fold pyridoxal phosphate-dependent enzyme [Limnochordia bacterium]